MNPQVSPKLPQGLVVDSAVQESIDRQVVMASQPNGDAQLQPTVEKGEQRRHLAPKRISNKDRHTKVEGRGRRVRMPPLCAARIFQLTRELGHKTDGETIQWLLQQAEPSIIAATGSGSIPALVLTSSSAGASSTPTASATASVGLHHYNLQELGQSRANWAMLGSNLGRSHPEFWMTPVDGSNGSFLQSATAAVPLVSNMPRFGFSGLELPTGGVNPMTFVPLLGGQRQPIPGLEISVSQHGQVGIFKPQPLSQFYQHIAHGSGNNSAGSDQLLQQQQQQEQEQQQSPTSDENSEGSTQ
ncbi:hypothetical protein BHE74_00012669 [Ensete ventricosum]|nr:hypothetical protein BHE74_00012669 [Ensete ventricosum]RZR91814.1 hypothetical protein BHM03_00019999 [Ensete ventricosum]